MLSGPQPDLGFRDLKTTSSSSLEKGSESALESSTNAGFACIEMFDKATDITLDLLERNIEDKLLLELKDLNSFPN